MALISLIHPSRGRSAIAAKTAKKWIERAGVDVEYILSIDADDNQNAYLYEFTHHWIIDSFNGKYCITNANRSAVDAINQGANKATGDIFIVMSDDFDCPNGWGELLLRGVSGKTDWIAKTTDGIQKWIITMPIMDRTYFNRFGYIYHPDYLHMFCDTELTCVADLTGRKITLDIPFTHNHYSTGKSQKDAVSIKADGTWNQGENLFINRAKMNFGLVNPLGKIESAEYISWMKQKGIKV